MAVPRLKAPLLHKREALSQSAIHHPVALMDPSVFIRAPRRRRAAAVPSLPCSLTEKEGGGGYLERQGLVRTARKHLTSLFALNGSRTLTISSESAAWLTPAACKKKNKALTKNCLCTDTSHGVSSVVHYPKSEKDIDKP